jgi:hypothetical protein
MQHAHGVFQRLSVGGIKSLQIGVDGRAVGDTFLPQGGGTLRRDADQHDPRVVTVDAARNQTRVFKKTDLVRHSRPRAVVKIGELRYPGSALSIDQCQSPGRGVADRRPDPVCGNSIESGRHVGQVGGETSNHRSNNYIAFLFSSRFVP